MRILTTGSLVAYEGTYPAAALMLRSWRRVVEKAAWKTPNGVRETYATASLVGNDRIVFNINGNSFRLIARIDYFNQMLFILWFGTHAEYNKINAATVTWKP